MCCKTRLDGITPAKEDYFSARILYKRVLVSFIGAVTANNKFAHFFPVSKNRFSPFKHNTFCKIISPCADSGIKWSTQAAATTMGSELRNRSSTSHLCSRRRCAYDICEPGWGRMWRDSNTGESFSPSTLMWMQSFLLTVSISWRQMNT